MFNVGTLRTLCQAFRGGYLQKGESMDLKISRFLLEGFGLWVFRVTQCPVWFFAQIYIKIYKSVFQLLVSAKTHMLQIAPSFVKRSSPEVWVSPIQKSYFF